MSDTEYVKVIYDDSDGFLGKYFVEINTEGFRDKVPIEEPFLTDKKTKKIFKFAEHFNLSSDERNALIMFVRGALYKQAANRECIYFGERFWISEKNTKLYDAKLINGVVVPDCHFWDKTGNLKEEAKETPKNEWNSITKFPKEKGFYLTKSENGNYAVSYWDNGEFSGNESNWIRFWKNIEG